MKKHAIIPIFIPHRGCPQDCVFCNQRKITARADVMTPEKVRERTEEYLQTLQGRGLETIELAFFGGSFTGIPADEQEAFLAVACEYKERGIIDKIHLSTRPDYIDKEVLDRLKRYRVDIIELGVQSFDEEVLLLANRGHNRACVYESSRLIKEYGFTLGIQLMVGLPGDTKERAIDSAMETVKIAPEIARIYPTIVIKDTELYEMAKRGDYTPLPLEEAIDISKEMYKILEGAGINVIRVGLKSSDIITEDGEMGQILGGTFHPAFRQLVEGAIAREQIERQLAALFMKNARPEEAQDLPAVSIEQETNGPLQRDVAHERDVPTSVVCYANPASFSNLIGNKGCNKKYFEANYPELHFEFQVRDDIIKGEYILEAK